MALRRSLDDLAAFVLQGQVEPSPKSGRQEHLERLIHHSI
jgi:xylose isomerase